MGIELREIYPTDDEARRLFRLLDAHNTSLCPPQECHLTQPEEFEQTDSILLGVFCDGALCGMGGLKFFDDYAEVSRMFVLQKYRGKGLAVMLLCQLEKKAAEREKTFLKLETSDKFAAAYRLYFKYGFKLCEPFGEYIHATFQHVYMEKPVAS